MPNRKFYLHYLCLFGAIALGAFLRFWHLGLKPLWMDEVITAIFSLGKNFHDLPLDAVYPLNRVQDIFTFQSGVSCSQIAENLTNQSTHPPLFFCGMHSWLEWMSLLDVGWVEKLRSLPALFGVAAIAAIYGVNRIAFSSTSGIVAAFLMAVSPFAVYLSQEARHYTLPMLMITLALLGLMQIQQDIFQSQRIRVWVWVLWAITNSIGLYVHYFFILAFIAQFATLLLLIYWGRYLIFRKQVIWLAIITLVGVVIISFIPWLLVSINHFRMSETNWLSPPNHIIPIFQTLITWILMVIALPVENQHLPIAVISGFLMVIFTIWLGWRVFTGLKLLWLQSTNNLAILTLSSFTAFVLLQLFAIVYLLGKDITVVPRYNFIYYPSFCALIAASLSASKKLTIKNKKSIFILLLVGVISSVFVSSNLVFQKPYQPDRVAQNMNLEPDVPVMLVVKYENSQDVALGLSFALALEKLREIKSDKLAFLQNKSGLSNLWEKLSQLPPLGISQLNLWIVAPGMIKADYPQQITLAGQTSCTIDPTKHYRIGVPYQLYRCIEKIP
jgi:uncharacterized membrane protein